VACLWQRQADGMHGQVFKSHFTSPLLIKNNIKEASYYTGLINVTQQVARYYRTPCL